MSLLYYPCNLVTHLLQTHCSLIAGPKSRWCQNLYDSMIELSFSHSFCVLCFTADDHHWGGQIFTLTFTCLFVNLNELLPSLSISSAAYMKNTCRSRSVLFYIFQFTPKPTTILRCVILPHKTSNIYTRLDTTFQNFLSFQYNSSFRCFLSGRHHTGS